jgi:membrane protein implicated in regulation of membrane protease activity
MIFWHWLILGIALILIELVAPGTYLLWVGLGALVTGVIVWLAPGLHWAYQAPIFAVLALGSAVAGKRVYVALAARQGDNSLNRRARHLVGGIHTLTTPIVNGTGRVHIGDGGWRVSGPDLPAGAKVRVVAADGITLQVEPVPPADADGGAAR